MNTENKTPSGEGRGQEKNKQTRLIRSKFIISQSRLFECAIHADPIQVWLTSELGEIAYTDYEFRPPRNLTGKFSCSADWLYINGEPLTKMIVALMRKGWEVNIYPDSRKIIDAVFMRALFQDLIFNQGGES